MMIVASFVRLSVWMGLQEDSGRGDWLGSRYLEGGREAGRETRRQPVTAGYRHQKILAGPKVACTRPALRQIARVIKLGPFSFHPFLGIQNRNIKSENNEKKGDSRGQEREEKKKSLGKRPPLGMNRAATRPPFCKNLRTSEEGKGERRLRSRQNATDRYDAVPCYPTTQAQVKNRVTNPLKGVLDPASK